MNFSEFKMLNRTQQEEWVLNQGNFIAVRQEPEFIIKLYQLDSFYVELFYHQVKKNPVSMRCFTNLNRLDPYLNGIDLGFMNC